MSSVIDNLERAQLRRVPNFAPGDRVKVHFQVIEGERRRTQVFEGVVIARQGSGARETFTVRKQSFGVGVERTFPVHSPKIEKIDVAARGDVRRAKLYYLRDRVGKGARVRERDYYGPEDEIAPGLVHQPAVAAEAPEGDEPQVDADNTEQDGVEASVDQAEGSDQADVAEVASDEAAQAESSDETAEPEADEQPEPEAEVADEQPEAEAADEQPEPEAEVADEQPEADSGEAAPAAEEDSEQPSDGSDEPSGDAA